MSNDPIYTPPPVTGYRKLSQAEVDLMNEIKAKGDELGALAAKLRVLSMPPSETNPQLAFVLDCECVVNAELFLKTGLMWLVRAVAKPTNF